MANTLKFGNGNWATKNGSTLAYNDESGFNPLPFDFTRASSATVVNKNGLIETVATGIPRIDFHGNTKGAMLLEPSRTNLITQSEAFGNSYWTKSGASIQGDPSTAGSELITVLADRDFSSDTGFWTKGSAWTISGGKSNVNGSLDTGTGTSFWKPSYLTVGKTYQVTFTISNYVSGSLALLQESGGTFYKSNGTFTQTFQAVNTGFGFNRSINLGGITNMSIDNVSLKEVQGFASPSADSPLGAFKLVESTDNSAHTITSGVGSVTSGATTTKSIIVKPNGRRWILLLDIHRPASRAWFDLELGVVGSRQSSAISSNIEKLSNGYFRCSVTSAVSATSSKLRMDIVLDNNATTGYQGDGTSGVFIFGSQLEKGSYSTSLINTSGSAVTRVSDACNNAGNAQVINSTQGVLYWEASALNNDIGTTRVFSINDGSSSNTLYTGYNSNSNVVQAQLLVGGVAQTNMLHTVSDRTNFIKVAILYQNNNHKMFINGVQVSTDTAGSVPSANTFNRINFDLGQGSFDFYGNIKDVRVFTTTLSDSELIALTQV
tara:strand:- start:50 stop:1693 length:1644 start_codon:yes stop_codon:yes gene_type:complete